MRIQSGEHTRYGFRHALIQDAAYDSLLKKDRVRHHHKTAIELVDGFPEICETRPELIAYHFTNAGIVNNAIDYWQKAGERAVNRFANAEAIAHYSRALKMMAQLEDSREHTHRELILWTALGAAHSIHDGWQAPETAHAYETAYELCQGLPNAPELFWVLWQLGAHYQSQEIAKGNAIALQLVKMAEAAHDPALLVDAKFGLSAGLFLAGRLAESYQILVETEELYDSEVDRSRISPTGQNIAVNNLLYFGMVKSLMGDLQGADTCFRRAVELARNHAGPPHQAAALCWRGFHFALQGDVERTLDDAEAAVSLATDFFLGRMWARTLRGWAHARQGIVEDGIREMSEAIDGYRSTGIRLLVSWLLTLQADGLLACGKHQECIAVANEALEVSNASGEKFSRADLYRIIGDARRESGVLDDAAELYRRAMKIAEAQGANTLVLKSSVGLGKLLVNQEKCKLARDALLKGCEPFDDDASLKYLDDARNLLQSLS
jgi:tetratricopeptide (TPR) repeat protein